MVLLIFPFYENLEDADRLGIFFFILETMGWLWGVAASLQWSTHSILAELSTALIYAPDLTTAYICVCHHQNFRQESPLSIATLSSFAVLVQNSLSIPGWKLLHSPSSRFQPFYWQINHPLSLKLFVCHHLTYLSFGGVIERHFVTLNIWDLDFLKEISIQENAYTHKNSPTPKRSKTKPRYICNICAVFEMAISFLTLYWCLLLRWVLALRLWR